MEIAWNKIRSEVDPIGTLDKEGNKESSLLYFERREPRPFGEGFFLNGDWLIANDEDTLFAYFKELILRETLFEDYMNGDAVPSFQDKDFSFILQTLISGAKEGEFESFHGGLAGLTKIEKWSASSPKGKKQSSLKYEELNHILSSCHLNLRVEYYPDYKNSMSKSLEAATRLGKRLSL
jgi:hypothetical protein